MRRLLLSLAVAPLLFADVERGVTPGAAGPNRLDADVALLRFAASDLRDLRLYDAAKREIGYLLVEPDAREPRWLDGHLLPIASTKTTSGFEVDLGEPADVDRIRFDGIAAPFLKRVRIEGSGDRARWTLLADATVFDLPDERLRLLEVPFDAGRYRYLRATWDDRSSARVIAGAASARVHGSGGAPEPLRADLAFTKRASEPGKSRYRVQLPAAGMAIEAIELRVANGNVHRSVTVNEPRLGTAEVVPVLLGSALVRRAERWGAVAEDLAIPIQRPSGRELDLVVDDGNNPPLALTAVVARFAPQPWIYFEAPDASPLVARYGNPRLAAPRYDVEASRAYLRNAAIAVARWEPATLAVPAPPAATDTVAALQGAPVDRGAFRVARAIPQAPPGLAVLLLDADALTRSNDLADLRIVDARNAQIPYLVERRDEPLVVPLTLSQARGEKGVTVHRFDLPVDVPPGARLVFETPARVFERGVVLRQAPNERLTTTFADTTWRSADPELLPPALALDAPAGQRSLELVVDEGDNAPLPVTGARLLLPSAALRFHHPGTPLFLLYGNAEAARPRYDLALLAPRLFGAPARELRLATVTPAAEEPSQTRERKFFWLAMIGAAVVLLALLTRLVVPRAVSD